MIKQYNTIGKMLRGILLGKGIPKINDETQIRLGHVANYLCLILIPEKDAYGPPPPKILIGPLMKTQIIENKKI